MKSIRAFLIATLFSVVTLGTFLAAVQGYKASSQRAQHFLDIQLADTAVLLSQASTGDLRFSEWRSDRLAFQIWSEPGELLQRSDNTPMEEITAFKPGYREENFAQHRWRVLSHFDDKSKRWVLVAQRIDGRIEMADSIVVQSILPVLASLPLVAAIVWFIVGRGLSFLGALATEVSTRRANDFSPLAIADPPIEVKPVVTAINDLLRRLSESLQRERRFSSDAAHELKTPVSALKVHAHNIRQEFADRPEIWRSLQSDIERLEHLIEQVMTLHKVNPEQYRATMMPTDLFAVAQDTIGDLFDEIENRGQTISLTGSTTLIHGDPASLRILLENLILNASKYSPENTEIVVQTGSNGISAFLDVIDAGPGIAFDEINRVLDPFYRGGGDRHESDATGCGLGLAIVQHIAALHFADVELHNNESGLGLTARVFFPENSGSEPTLVNSWGRT